MTLGHVPERTCVACRQPRPKRELVRIVRTAEGSVQVDPTGKLSGRGAYLCRQASCWKAGLRRDALGRALKVSITPSDRAALEAYAAALPVEAEPLAAGAHSQGP
jgi:hypothetical protein